MLTAEGDGEVFGVTAFELLEEGFSTVPGFFLKWVDARKLHLVTSVSAQYATIDERSLWETWLLLSCGILKFKAMKLSEALSTDVNLKELSVSGHDSANNSIVFLWIIFIRIKWQNIDLNIFLLRFAFSFFSEVGQLSLCMKMP